MQAPYLPPPDAAFDAWSQNFSTLITADPTTYGLIAGDATAIAAVVDAFHTAYGLASNPVTRTAVTIAAKDAARVAAEPVLRDYAQQISRNAGVDNSDKTAVGVNLPNTARPPIPQPTTQPQLALVSSVHNLQVISYKDSATPTTKAKPFGAIGIDLRVSISLTPAASPDNVPPFGVITKSPVNIGMLSGDAGKTARYWGRWVTRSGPGGMAQYGPWSAPMDVVVT